MGAIQRNFTILTHWCQEAKKENYDLHEINRKLRKESRQLRIDIESMKARLSILGEASQELNKERATNQEIAEKNSTHCDFNVFRFL